MALISSLNEIWLIIVFDSQKVVQPNIWGIAQANEYATLRRLSQGFAFISPLRVQMVTPGDGHLR
jgi:hypothetical protein